jgi:hypothetical protein
MFVCGLMLVAGSAFAQRTSPLMQAPAPESIRGASRIQSTAQTAQANSAASKEADQHLNRQVSATQQLLQQEEKRLQTQFIQLQKLRAAALEKQDKKELDRIERLEKQVVADYQKRVERILINAQTMIQSKPIQVQPTQAQPTKVQPRQTPRTQQKATKARTTQSKPTGTSKAQAKKPQTRKPSQSKQRQSSRFGLFGRR